jgi:hypothetical protein
MLFFEKNNLNLDKNFVLKKKNKFMSFIFNKEKRTFSTIIPSLNYSDINLPKIPNLFSFRKVIKSRFKREKNSFLESQSLLFNENKLEKSKHYIEYIRNKIDILDSVLIEQNDFFYSALCLALMKIEYDPLGILKRFYENEGLVNLLMSFLATLSNNEVLFLYEKISYQISGLFLPKFNYDMPLTKIEEISISLEKKLANFQNSGYKNSFNDIEASFFSLLDELSKEIKRSKLNVMSILILIRFSEDFQTLLYHITLQAFSIHNYRYCNEIVYYVNQQKELDEQMDDLYNQLEEAKRVAISHYESAEYNEFLDLLIKGETSRYSEGYNPMALFMEPLDNFWFPLPEKQEYTTYIEPVYKNLYKEIYI